LPTCLELTDEMIRHVVDQIAAFFDTET